MDEQTEMEVEREFEHREREMLDRVQKTMLEHLTLQTQMAWEIKRLVRYEMHWICFAQSGQEESVFLFEEDGLNLYYCVPESTYAFE